jgi:quaternary ammonium compound-resistance protein SugE
MTASMAWLALGVAGLLDVAWAISMKQSQGYTRLGWTLVSLVLLALFVFLLGRALQMLPVGVAYAVWTGIGAVGTVLAGWLLFNEALAAASIFGVVLVLAGIVVLKLAHG